MDASRLRSVPLFEGMSDDDLRRCADLFEEAEILQGSGLAREGEFAYKFFVVLDGEVEVLRDFTPAARLGPGDFFGEMGLVGGERRNARVVAHTRCGVAWMMVWDFRTMAEEFPEIAGRIEKAVADRMSSLPDGDS
jgi:CRP/FNR family cyclic AMP-dependent transcriptional regulator